MAVTCGLDRDRENPVSWAVAIPESRSIPAQAEMNSFFIKAVASLRKDKHDLQILQCSSKKMKKAKSLK